MQNYPQSITDKFAYFSVSNGSQPSLYRWPLCDYAHRTELPQALAGSEFAVDDTLFVRYTYSRDGHRGAELVSFDGQNQFTPQMAKHESVAASNPVRLNEAKNRIAIPIVTLRGGNRTLDIGDHVTARRVAMYDIDSGREIVSIPAKAEENYDFQFDLSPDGHRLAILEDDVLRVVDLDRMTQPSSR